MKNNKFALQILAFVLIISSFIACDKDFSTLESDIINDDVATNFDILSEQYNIITYTDPLDPVQTNGLGLNTLGIYDDLYGRTTSSFVTQVTTSVFDPDFGDGVSIDSVVLTIPYFGFISETDEDGNNTYEIDSVIGRDPIKLSLFESNYFIRDFDPDAEFNEAQAYFSNKSASATEMISEAALEGEELSFVDYNEETGEFDPIDNTIDISEEGYILTGIDDEGETQILQRQFPGIRVLLDTTFWRSKIIDKEGDAVLSSQNNFLEYFRGIYFKAEAVDDNGSFLILNTGAITSNITIYYTRLTSSTTDEEDETEQATFELRFGPSRINFMDNDFTTPLNDGNSTTGDSKLYLKGGEGSVARIKLFNGDNEDDNPEINAFEEFRSAFVETENGKFVRSKRLINEANLVFYVDRETLDQAMEDPNNEPNRIYLYNTENNIPLDDFFLDNLVTSIPSLSISNHLGPLQRVEDESNGNGIKYKLRITEHINDLLVRDSTNVELGLAISLNVNLEDPSIGGTQRQVQSMENPNLKTPVSSIITPRGTVLHGSNTEDESKKVYLEIYYTEPNE